MKLWLSCALLKPHFGYTVQLYPPSSFLIPLPRMIQSIASATHLSPSDKEFAQHLDQNDDLKEFRDEFLFPPSCKGSNVPSTYLCGNSLGIQPRKTRDYILNQLDKWGSEGVEGHFTDPTPWLTIDDIVVDSMARLVGALPSEVVLMNSLTVNLHLMMVSFYQPTALRNKILIEKKAFPSDVHAVVSQILHHKLDPAVTLLEISPREGEVLLRTEDIEAIIAAEGDSIALVLFSGVQYYTGQLFDMSRISKAAKKMGCKVGFDLAHAVGNECKHTLPSILFILSLWWSSSCLRASADEARKQFYIVSVNYQTSMRKIANYKFMLTSSWTCFVIIFSLIPTASHFLITGNVPLQLHDWGCDFACWCTYKYMNCGPGSIGGCFVHESHSIVAERVAQADTKVGRSILRGE